MIVLPEDEWRLRVQRYQQLRSQVTDGLSDEIALVAEMRTSSKHTALDIVTTFLDRRDAAELRAQLDAWHRHADTTKRWGFGGPNGQMFLNQIVNDSEPAVAADVLAQCVRLPADNHRAAEQFETLRAHVELLRSQGSSVQEGRVAPLLTWFWWLQDPDQWPVLWTSVWGAFERLGFLSISRNWDGYSHYREHIRRFGTFAEVEMVIERIANTEAYGLDITASPRLDFVDQHRTLDSTDPESFNRAKAHLELLRQSVKPLGRSAASALEDVFGSEVSVGRPSIWWQSSKNRLRRNLYMSWTPDTEAPTASLLLVGDAHQVQVGLQASSVRAGQKGLLRASFDLLGHDVPDGTEWMLLAGSTKDPDRPLSEIPIWALLGRTFSYHDFSTHDEAIRHIVETAEALMPAFEKVWELDATADAPAHAAPPVQPGEAHSLESLRDQFIAEENYPNDRDKRDRAARREWTPLVQRGAIASTPLADLRRMYNGSSFGSPGPQSILNTTLADEDPDVIDRFRRAIDFLLWGPGSDAERIDAVMDESQLGLRGFKEGAIMKFLAIAHPDRFLAVYPFSGTQGKAAMLQALNLDVPDMSDSLGSRQIAATKALKAVVAPLFPDDAWGQSRFLYWLANRAAENPLTLADLEADAEIDVDPIGTAAEELLLDRSFLDEVHDLLSAHRQLIFYGPPGTGKTYVAQRLAEAIAPGTEQRMLIQFHPSTSYEDFFEGYRPITTSDDQIVYKLVPGPLRIMAERAAQDLSKRPHVLIIDEINRANLAKVLGELLFLLEYRDREIQPLYRPGEPFSLPENLWIIGTMNTADRSIATVDAAMRRRFHFVPFVPDDKADNPLSGLLARWLDENGEPGEVADLVDGVNQHLRGEMGGDHLLIGPSYFMTSGLDRERLETIWKYRIEPLIDDLFFGDARAKKLHFEAVWNEFGFGDGGADEEPEIATTTEES